MADAQANSVGGTTPNERLRKPANDNFKQQRLKAWQPMLTARTVLPFFAFLGIVFIPIGVGLFIAAHSVSEVTIDYTTDCKDTTTRESCSTALRPPATCRCLIEFELENDFAGDVNVYYALENFYQNHRRYVKSRDDYQLLGNLDQEVSSDCSPYDEATAPDGKLRPVAPCGAIANSLFNDTFQLELVRSTEPEKTLTVPLQRTGIAWWSDKNLKFGNPKNLDDFKPFMHPEYWTRNVTELDEENPSNNAFENEDFIVWMRTAAFPSFRKLHRRLHRKDRFKNGLPAGTYRLNVSYNYPVVGFGGRKAFIMSTVSWLGGKNTFLGVAYMTVGGICILLSVVFLFIHRHWGRHVNIASQDTDGNPGW